jgi:hypothetical protein
MQAQKDYTAEEFTWIFLNFGIAYLPHVNNVAVFLEYFSIWVIQFWEETAAGKSYTNSPRCNTDS